MATLLPNAVQQFIDENGDPLAGGFVYFYVPNTSTPKDTWSDPDGEELNPNPIELNAAGENPDGGIYGTGAYRQRVTDADGNLIWDQVTADTAVGGLAWGGVSTGAADAQVIAASSFSSQDGQQVAFVAGYTNTGATTITPGAGSTPIPVLKNSDSGPTPLTGGEIVEDNVVLMIYDATVGSFVIVSAVAIEIPTTFLDGVFRIQNTADPTKQLAFTIAGVTTATTVTWTVQNASGTVALLDLQDQTITGGARVTPLALNSGNPVTTGTVTVDPGDCQLQSYTNGGAHELEPGANTGSVLVDITNNGSAGAITTSGWTKVVGSFDTTNGHAFRCACSISTGGSLLVIQPLF